TPFALHDALPIGTARERSRLSIRSRAGHETERSHAAAFRHSAVTLAVRRGNRPPSACLPCRPPAPVLGADCMEPFLDTGVTAWMLVSASFVLLMTPGLALFYGGMTRSKSILNMMMMCFGAMAVVGCIYVLWGWSMSYGESLGGIVGNPFDQFGLGGSFDPVSILNEETGAYMPTIVDVGFQATFAIITVALIAGSIADRAKYATWLVFAGLWATLSYFPMSHMVWGDGLLSGAGPFASIAEPIDFAGGTVVHINAGVAGLVLALVIGKRKGWPGEAFK